MQIETQLHMGYKTRHREYLMPLIQYSKSEQKVVMGIITIEVYSLFFFIAGLLSRKVEYNSNILQPST